MKYLLTLHHNYENKYNNIFYNVQINNDTKYIILVTITKKKIVMQYASYNYCSVTTILR
jgi:hypothetical protein